MIPLASENVKLIRLCSWGIVLFITIFMKLSNSRSDTFFRRSARMLRNLRKMSCQGQYESNTTAFKLPISFRTNPNWKLSFVSTNEYESGEVFLKINLVNSAIIHFINFSQLTSQPFVCGEMQNLAIFLKHSHLCSRGGRFSWFAVLRQCFPLQSRCKVLSASMPGYLHGSYSFNFTKPIFFYKLWFTLQFLPWIFCSFRVVFEGPCAVYRRTL